MKMSSAFGFSFLATRERKVDNVVLIVAATADQKLFSLFAVSQPRETRLRLF